MNKVDRAIEVYDSIAQKYSDTFDSDLSDNPRIDTFVSYLPKDAVVIDVGCGTGIMTKYIQSKGVRVSGIDLSSSMLEIAKRNHPEIDFKLEDMRAMHYPDAYFDGMWAGHSLFHLTREEFQKALFDFNVMLKKEGILGFVMNEGVGDVELPEPLDSSLTIPLTLYTDEELTKLLDAAGFKIVERDRKEPIMNSDYKPYQKLLIIASKK